MSQETIHYPELTPELQRGVGWHSLKYFGAGAIIASVTIGSGETLFASRGGALFGYAILWCFVGGTLMKGVQVYTSARYMVLTGEHPLTHWAFLPGPRGWAPLVVGVISLACFPFWLAGLPLMIGKTINWIFGVSATDPDFLLFSRGWGTLCIVIAVSLTWIQSYGALEKVQTFIVGILLVSMLAACFAAQPDWLAALYGSLLPMVPDYEPWVTQEYPAIAQTPVWIELGLYLGAIGGGAYDYFGYIGCFREKDWGAIGLRREAQSDGDLHETQSVVTSVATLPIDTGEENVRRGRAWLIPAKIDTGGGFACVLFFTICFVLLGAAILHPQHKIPDGEDLLTHQADFLTRFHPSFLYVYQIGIFMAFFGTIYGAYEIYMRTAYECLMPISRRLRAMPIRRFRLGILMYCAIGGLALMWSIEDPLKIVTPAAIVGGVLLCGLWCFAMIWVDRKFLPRPFQMGFGLLTLNWISGSVLTVLGLLSLWVYIASFF